MKNSIYILSVISLLSTGLIRAKTEDPSEELVQRPVSEIEKEQVPDYNKAFDLMKDFLDLTKKTDSTINYWAKQLLLLIQKKEKEQIQRLAPFLKDFRAAAKTRDAFALGMAFKIHKDKFNEPELAAYLTKRIQEEGLDSLLQIMKQRMKKK